MFDHVMLHVSNYEKSKAWYSEALKPLGVKVIKEVPEAKSCGFGTSFPAFWIAQGELPAKKLPVHLAFQAASRAKVREFHAASLQAGGQDNGAPGFRPQYHPMYYGAFVLDPDGYNVEAVKHMPEGVAEWGRFAWSMLTSAAWYKPKAA